MKPFSTSTRLLSRVLVAISSWARAASRLPRAWATRASYSVPSVTTTICPARTDSPSRTKTCRTSAGTRALTVAMSTARSDPDKASVCRISTGAAVTTSCGRNSRVGGVAATVACAGAAGFAGAVDRCIRPQTTPPATIKRMSRMNPRPSFFDIAFLVVIRRRLVQRLGVTLLRRRLKTINQQIKITVQIILGRYRLQPTGVEGVFPHH